MKIKVCGMKDPDNIRELVQLNPDFIGFIFFEGSRRYVGKDFSLPDGLIPDSIKKIGVFVKEKEEKVIELAREHDLYAVQLHGDEPVPYCRRIRSMGIKVIKVLRIDSDLSSQDIHEFRANCDYFLFDTRSKLFGGTGRKFDWKVLELTRPEKPFFLSGGIGPGDAEEINRLSFPDLYAIDLNSRFEIEPGFKDIGKLDTFFGEIRSAQRLPSIDKEIE